MAFRAPLLGYNTNVRHKGKLYHIQTEDSGVDHPHVLTHLFADGGRVVASKKTSYADRVGAEGLQDIVKKLMQGQHKAMFIALRDGVYDEDASDQVDETTAVRPPAAAELPAAAPVMMASTAAQEDETLVNEPETLPPIKRQGPPSAVFKAPKLDAMSEKSVAEKTVVAKPASAPRSLFGADLMSDKGLDEVILNYLAANEKDA